MDGFVTPLLFLTRAGGCGLMRMKREEVIFHRITKDTLVRSSQEGTV